MTGALGTAAAAGCAEVFTAHLAEAAGTILPRLGLFAESARVLAAAGTWRVNGPRSVVEEREVAAVLEQLRDELTPEAYEAQCAAGRPLTVDDVLVLLSRLLAELSDS